MAPVVLRIQWKEINVKFRIELRKTILEMSSIKHSFSKPCSVVLLGKDFSHYLLISLSLCLGNSNSPSGQMLLPQGHFPDPQTFHPLQPSPIEFIIVLFHSTLKLSLIVPIMVPVICLFMFLVLCMFIIFACKLHEGWHHICFTHCCVSGAKCSAWHLEVLNTFV